MIYSLSLIRYKHVLYLFYWMYFNQTFFSHNPMSVTKQIFKTIISCSLGDPSGQMMRDSRSTQEVVWVARHFGIVEQQRFQANIGQLGNLQPYFEIARTSRMVDVARNPHLAASADRCDEAGHWRQQPGGLKQTPLLGGQIQRPNVAVAALRTIKTARNVDDILAGQRLVLGTRKEVAAGRIAGTRC